MLAHSASRARRQRSGDVPAGRRSRNAMAGERTAS